MECIADDKTCEGGLFPAGSSDFQHATPSLKFSEPAFGDALLSVYLSTSGIVPDAREQWAKAAKSLLDGNTNFAVSDSH